MNIYNAEYDKIIDKNNLRKLEDKENDLNQIELYEEKNNFVLEKRVLLMGDPKRTDKFEAIKNRFEEKKVTIQTIRFQITNQNPEYSTSILSYKLFEEYTIQTFSVNFLVDLSPHY